MNIMVTTTPLPNVGGRVDYISNPARQENLQAVYSEVDTDFWRGLSEHCQKSAAAAGHKKAREAREFMMPLANDLFDMFVPYTLARVISQEVKEYTGTENTVAIHWNKTKTNYHCHIIVAENEAVEEVKRGAVLTRNTYYAADGKRSTKSKCIDADGELLPGCRFYPKGSCVEQQLQFGAKKKSLATKGFLQQFKQRMADLQNELLQEKRFETFDSSLYLRQQHIGKGRPAEQVADMKAKNSLKSDFNSLTREILVRAENLEERAKFKATEALKSQRDRVKNFAHTKDFWNEVKRSISLKEDFKEELKDRLFSIEEEMQDGSTLSLFKQVLEADRWQQEQLGHDENENQDELLGLFGDVIERHKNEWQPSHRQRVRNDELEL